MMIKGRELPVSGEIVRLVVKSAVALYASVLLSAGRRRHVGVAAAAEVNGARSVISSSSVIERASSAER